VAWCAVHAFHYVQSDQHKFSLLVCISSAGGDLTPAVQEADEQIGKKGKPKVSRKERLQRKREQKRAERQAGSDDEDVNQGECELTAGPFHCISQQSTVELTLVPLAILKSAKGGELYIPAQEHHAAAAGIVQSSLLIAPQNGSAHAMLLYGLCTLVLEYTRGCIPGNVISVTVTVNR